MPCCEAPESKRQANLLAGSISMKNSPGSQIAMIGCLLLILIGTELLQTSPAHASSIFSKNFRSAPRNPTRKGSTFSTRASWYGGRFHGRRTASGARFDQNQLTAASPNLPFGTRVLVKNPKNGHSCPVVINDRGPYVHGRGIDLSKAAAQKLGISGVSPVICYADSSAPGGYRTVKAVRTKSGGYRFRITRIFHRVEYRTAHVLRRFKRVISSLF